MLNQVKQMECQGYLEQVPDLSDTRAKVVRMTPRGDAVKAACAEVREELNQAIAMRVGKGKAREMEAHLDVTTQAFADIAAES
jgi:DNA-binding MarR family transcriptional regulator